MPMPSVPLEALYPWLQPTSPIAKPKKKVLIVEGITSAKVKAEKTVEKYNCKLSPFRIFKTVKPPIKAMVSAYIISNGIIKVVAVILVTTRNLKGLVAETSIASICSETFIEPSSAPIPEPIFPAQIKPVMTGPISRTMEMDIIVGINETAPNWVSIGIDCKARTKPIINPVTLMRPNDLFPISKNCLNISLNSYGGLKTS